MERINKNQLQNIRDWMYNLDIVIYDEKNYGDKYVFILDNMGLHSVDIKRLQSFGDININLWAIEGTFRLAVVYYFELS